MSRYSIIGLGVMSLGASLVLPGCSDIADGSTPVEQAVAKCELAVLSEAGANYRKNYMAQWGDEENDDALKWGDTSYRQYFSLCMQSKGWKFRAMDRTDEECWASVGDGLPSMNVTVASCWDG